MKNLTKALITLKSASIGQIRAYAGEVQYQLISDGYDAARSWATGRFLDEEEWQDACQSADEAQNNAHHAAAPFRWIAFYSEVERASELFRALAEGWRRCLEYFEGFDPMAEAQMILDLMAARITLNLEDVAEEGGAE